MLIVYILKSGMRYTNTKSNVKFWLALYNLNENV